MAKKVTISAISGSGEGSPLKPPQHLRTVFREEAHLLASASESLQNAGITGEAASRTGIILGIDGPIDGWKEDYFKSVLKDGPIGASPLVFPYTSPNAITARATIAFGLKGQAITIASGPLSFFKALAYASLLFGAGKLESALVAGVAIGSVMTLVINGAGQVGIDSAEGFLKPPGYLRTISCMKETFAILEDAARLAEGKTDVIRTGAGDRWGGYVTLGLSGAAQ